MQKIEFIIDKDGNVTTSVSGIKGKGCKDLTKNIEKALGIIKSETKTAQYYERELNERLYNRN